VGAPGAVIAAPASAEVAGLVGQRNVFDGRVVEGGVETPLGLLAVDPAGHAGPVALLVPPSAVVPSPDGPLRGRVRGLLYRSGTPVAIVAGVGPRDDPDRMSPTAGPTLDVLAEPGWVVGDEVTLRIHAASVHLMVR
jgi:ABC-type Fe3+/spermidine/putrescine transport system ATPase subunit